MDEDTSRRIEKLEVDLDELYSVVSSLSTNTALLTQSLELMTKTQDRRNQIFDKVSMVAVGVVVSAVVTWVIRGGLV